MSPRALPISVLLLHVGVLLAVVMLAVLSAESDHMLLPDLREPSAGASCDETPPGKQATLTSPGPARIFRC